MRSKLSLFSDLPPILDAIVAAGGGTYTLATPGDATHWRQRVYQFRLAYQQELGPSPYDVLVLHRPRGCEVDISLRRAAGVFTPRVAPAVGDKYEDEAFALARRMLGDE
jgi:hypothetical protein